ncbi:MAG TPA: hypothetical protein DCL15_13055 [Chloroflexi bacterium]|nr:hypothetical protein [Chloroflexota bacterium]HHW88260.1 hypothetical protein [Chloroflexota bacterium]
MRARNRPLIQRTLRRERNLVVALHSVALTLLGLHLYVRTLPPTPAPIPPPDSAEAAWWGLWPITYLPTWAVLVGVMAVVAVIVAYWLASATRRAPEEQRGAPPMSARWLWPALWLVSLALVAAFFLFPIAHTRWGDAFMLAKGIAYPDPSLRLTHSWQAPLDVALHSWLWQQFHATFRWEDAAPVYRLVSPIAGALFLLVLLRLSRRPLLAPGWLPYALFATLGLMQLFFGYIENYSMAAVGVLAYLWLGLIVIERRRSLWLAATILALTHAIHPSTIVLAPSLLYLGGHLYCAGQAEQSADSAVFTPSRNQTLLVVVLQIALPMLVIGSATFLFMEASGHGVAALLSTDRPGGGDARWFVPLWATTTRWEHYTMFSWAHLRDWLNGQLLVAPVVLPSLAVAGAWIVEMMRNRIKREWQVASGDYISVPSSDANLQFPPSPSHHLTASAARFLVIASACYLLFTFVWNPDYGGQRDWDLFSLAALPTTLLLALLLVYVLRGRALWGAAVPLLLVQGWHTLAWIYQNTLPWQWPD